MVGEDRRCITADSVGDASGTVFSVRIWGQKNARHRAGAAVSDDARESRGGLFFAAFFLAVDAMAEQFKLAVEAHFFSPRQSATMFQAVFALLPFDAGLGEFELLDLLRCQLVILGTFGDALLLFFFATVDFRAQRRCERNGDDGNEKKTEFHGCDFSGEQLKRDQHDSGSGVETTLC